MAAHVLPEHRLEIAVPTRLDSAPSQALFELLYEPAFARDLRQVLPYLLDIDAAHAVMLARVGILAAGKAGAILGLNRRLAAAVRAGEPVLEPPAAHRGLYLVYERHFIDQLGAETGGAAHVARSRNDINASVTRMRLRQEMLAVLRQALAVCATATEQASRHAATLASGFSHLQPAQPSTLGHYLAAVTSELVRDAERLWDTLARANVSPLGAGAGFGTSFAIDRRLTSDLLGFDGAMTSSLDAVASRDYVLETLGGLAILGITLTRLATDLQLWSSHAYEFLSWPDELMSTSSMMPQKRNAFVLESIRGKGAALTGHLVAALAVCKGTPFANSVEVSAEATAPLWPALAETKTALRLLALLLGAVEVQPAKARGFVEGARTTMTALADHLVAEHGLAFRTAHQAVASLAAGLAKEGRADPAQVAERLSGILAEPGDGARAVRLDSAAVARALDPDACVAAAVHGGGPGAVAEQVRDLAARRAGLQARIDGLELRLAAAAARLEAAAAEVIAPSAERA